jgi:hypothetical protein
LGGAGSFAPAALGLTGFEDAEHPSVAMSMRRLVKRAREGANIIDWLLFLDAEKDAGNLKPLPEPVVRTSKSPSMARL